MSQQATSFRSHVTLAFCAILHALSHAYGQLLVPLYLMIVADLRLSGVRAASLIVTIYGLAYCIGSYPAGILADRFNRKTLLAVGLIGNALAMIAMGLTRQYEMLVVLAIIAGMFGTLFHPAANALVPAHYPKSPGMAIGLLGIGSGLGFFFGPQYAGWRAQTATWHWGSIADWQRPCIEMGIIGITVGIAFLIFGSETSEAQERQTGDAMLPNRVGIEAVVPNLRGEHARTHPPISAKLRKQVIAIAAVLSFRDFAGIATISLLSIYLQKAHDYTPKQTGLIVGLMMLISVIVNPLAVYLSPGRKRLPALSIVLVLGGVTLLFVPFLAIAWVLPVMCLFQAFQFGSYAISDAALLERVSPKVRGRVVGLFLTLAGTFASISPWVMGGWTDWLGLRAAEPHAYFPIFATLTGMMWLASISPPLIAKLNEPTESLAGLPPSIEVPTGLDHRLPATHQ
ncbi:MAG TPA: MFS transporter [Tepidisphaeraceae bacterium]|nr:MFS transporter [Tepidisphaeraceae bacterium]